MQSFCVAHVAGPRYTVSNCVEEAAMGEPKATVNLQVRLPEGLRKKLAREAEKNARSLNAEVVYRLAQSVEGKPQAPTSEQLIHGQPAIEEFFNRLIDEVARNPDLERRLVEGLPGFRRLDSQKGKQNE
jgi:hypothetical protein